MSEEYTLKSNKVILEIFADIIDDQTRQQIFAMAKHPAVSGRVAMMPDCHAGKGCVVGTTLEVGDNVVPNFIGVDIGCGVLGVKIPDCVIDFKYLDRMIRSQIPLGMRHRSVKEGTDLALKLGNSVVVAREVADKIGIQNDIRSQIGTLGGGNHFIEIAQGDGCKWVFIHSGSRNFGLQVAKYHQAKAKELCDKMNIKVPGGSEYLPMDMGGKEYLHDMIVAQNFAQLNRRVMMGIILKILGVTAIEEIESVHNYISDTDSICRKGAISAYKGEKVLIPLNMRDGTVIGVGKGNTNANNSAPHGAGRIGSRSGMKRKLATGELTMDDFRNEMSGIFSTSVKESTIDESPMAYKPFEAIQKYLEHTVEIIEIVKPIYNLKAD